MSKPTRQELAQQWGGQLAWYLEQQKEVALSRPGYGAPPQVRPIPSCRLMTFALKLAHSVDGKKLLKMEEEIALEIGVRVCTIRRHYGEVLVTMPLPSDLWTFISASKLPEREGTWVTVGYGSDMQPVYVDLAGTNICPMLIAGRTGSGKTELMKLLMWRLALQNTPEAVKFIIQDPKYKFKAIHMLPHLALPILRTYPEGAIGVGWALREMKDRMNGKSMRPRIIMFFDELIDAMGPNPNTDVGRGIGELARLGREVNINLVLATQRPDRAYMDKLSAANIGVRFVGAVTDSPEAVVATGIGGTPARHLEGKGDMIVIMHGEVVNRMQVAMVEPRRFAALPRLEQPPPMPEKTKSILEEMGVMGLGQTIVHVPPFSVDELVFALTNAGIVKMKRELRMGQPKATRLRNEWGKPMLDKLQELGYTVTRGGVEAAPEKEEDDDELETVDEIQFPASSTAYGS